MKATVKIPVAAYKASGFIKKYQNIVKDSVIPYQHSVLWDRAEGSEKSHVAANFINAARVLRGDNPGDGFYGMVFQDSDAYKWLEAAAYSLASQPDCVLEKEADELIELIASSQDGDGYINTAFTIKDRERRWTNLLEGHELYCSGHMIEAACAYFEATGKALLLEVAKKNADCIYRRFITEGNEGVPGHPEIELALMKLFRLTGDRRYLELSEHFINERGKRPDFWAREAEKRNWSVWGSNPWDNDYRQSARPVREQTEATGHAVRAVYLYTGMADLASEAEDEELLEACRRLWRNIVDRRMYITGGIGSTVNGEAFTVDYDLPPDTAYSETCAAIGLIFFGSSMLENEIKGEYGDIMELAFYNTVLAGMQLDGKRFFYVNPLEIDLGISGRASTHSHVLPSRPGWYACACCPPNVARMIGSIGSYAYGEKEDTVYCHLFAPGSVKFANGISLECVTDYPYDMNIKYAVKGSGIIAIRIPKWSRTYALRLNGEEADAAIKDGYAYIRVCGSAEIQLMLDGSPRFIRACSSVPRLTGMTALMRGPLVYCFEGADNGGIRDILLDKSAAPTVGDFSPELLGGTVTLTVKAYRISDINSLYSDEEERLAPCEATAVPYYTWGNRGENDMRVWMSYR